MTKRRVLLACAAYLTAGIVAVSCAGSEEEIFDTPQPDAGSSGGTSSGTGGKAGTGGTSGFGGSTGGTGGVAGSSGTGGKAGTGGTGGTGGASGSSGTGGSGSCNKAFCPNTGMGTPCCVTANGPCGMDNGNGCQGGGGTDGGP